MARSAFKKLREIVKATARVCLPRPPVAELQLHVVHRGSLPPFNPSGPAPAPSNASSVTLHLTRAPAASDLRAALRKTVGLLKKHKARVRYQCNGNTVVCFVGVAASRADGFLDSQACIEALQPVEGFCVVPDAPKVWVSVSLISLARCVAVEVEVARLATFLDRLGKATAEAKLLDPQFWLQKRTAKRKGEQGLVLSGMVIETEQRIDDLPSVIARGGLPMPHNCFTTVRGHRVCIVFTEPVSEEEYRHIARAWVLALPGADVACLEPTQGNRLPTCIRTVPDGIVTVEHTPLVLNPSPTDPAAYFGKLPKVIERMLGGRSNLSDTELSVVEAWLQDRGIPAPAQEGRLSYDRCPADDHHNQCCYINRRENGGIFVHCLSNHDGCGPRSWTDTDLYREGTGDELGVGHANVLHDVPVTHAGVSYIRSQLGRSLDGHDKVTYLIDEGVEYWKSQVAYHELARWERKAKKLAAQVGANQIITPGIEGWQRLHSERLEGIDRAGPFHLFFDKVHRELKLQPEKGPPSKLNNKGTSVPRKNHAHEWAATTTAYIGCHALTTGKGDDQTTVVVTKRKPMPHVESLFNKALRGHPGCLRALGIASLTKYQFPVAHLDETWNMDPDVKVIEASIPPSMVSATEPVDAVSSFLGLYRSGQLPLASENDVLLFLVALAAPLLRDLLAGQLGVFHFTGPSGAGKDLLAELLSDIWMTTNPWASKAKFDLALVGEEEQRRSFAMAGDALYARAKEAGKDRRSIDRLIKLGGTDTMSARALWRDEINVKNSYVYVADSVEDFPQRKEVSRRTVTITVAHMDDKIQKGLVLRDIIAMGPAIIADLKRRIEQNPPEWYQHQAETGSRPLAPVALARLLNADLSEVKGTSMDVLFEAMAEYTEKYAGEEGPEQQAKARPGKDAKELALFPNFRGAHFIDQMKRRAGYEQVMKQYKSARNVEMWLNREADYADVTEGRRPYLPVEMGDKRYAFKLVKGRRNFVLVDEEDYCNTVGLPCPMSVPKGGNGASGSAPPAPSTETEKPPNEEEINSDSLCFSDRDLLG